MLEKFQQYMQENSLAGKDDRLLLAVSGGIDSMVMAHLFIELGIFHVAMAHCNFRLRGEESDKDQEFVRDIAKRNNIEFFTDNFNTQQYAADKRISIQMAARELRYSWFNKLAQKFHFHRIAVAHNQDDLVETLIINLVRGTGAKGLTGIKPQNGLIIRPLLFSGRREIEEYAKNHAIGYREDSSNAETKYKRNLIRHKILPLLEQLNPAIRETISQETEVFSATWNIYKREIERLKRKIITRNQGQYLLSISKLEEHKITPPLLFDMLSEFEFTYPMVKSIFKSLDAESGKKFFASGYMLVKDRNTLIIEKLGETAISDSYQIDDTTTEISVPLPLAIYKFKREKDFDMLKPASVAALDLDKLIFPLKLRHWEEGDYFYPLGLGGKKKLSDFFIDTKIDLFGKKKIWLLTSGTEIVWILGYRIDERYKITPQTKNIMMLEIKD